jgi:hypothetical protein
MTYVGCSTGFWNGTSLLSSVGQHDSEGYLRLRAMGVEVSGRSQVQQMVTKEDWTTHGSMTISGGR